MKFIRFNNLMSIDAIDLSLICTLFNTVDFCNIHAISIFMSFTKLQAIYLPYETISQDFSIANVTELFIVNASMNPNNNIENIVDISGQLKYDASLLNSLLCAVTYTVFFLFKYVIK